MAFPSDPLPILAEIPIDGVWTDVTDRVRLSDSIVIDRGFRNESGNSITPALARFTLNNRDAFFSTKAPTSVNYGKLPPGTSVRFSVEDPDGMALNLVNGYDGGSEIASTADKAVLDVTGDLEIRADLKPDAWIFDNPAASRIIVGKYNTTGDQRSWYVSLTHDGKLRLIWSSAGTGATLNTVESSAAVPFANHERGSIGHLLHRPRHRERAVDAVGHRTDAARHHLDLRLHGGPGGRLHRVR
jgi:hypothetical protein